MDEPRGLAADGFHQGRVVVAQAVHRDTGGEIQVTFALPVGEPGPGPLCENHREPVVGIHEGIREGLVHSISPGVPSGGTSISVTIGHHLGADAFVGKEFQEQGMGDSAIYNVGLLNPRIQGYSAAVHLGNHPLAHNALFDKPIKL